MAVHAILAVPREVVDAGVLVTEHMHLLVLALFPGSARALLDGEILLGTQCLDATQLCLQLLVLRVVFIQVHHTINNG
jgi:hypothetical protein